jgi:hypothetical protein
MKSIRYSLHFSLLIVAGLLYWLAKNVYLPAWLANFDFFHFGLMGLLHATAIVVSLRDRKAVRPVLALCFIIALATTWAALTPVMGMWSLIVLPDRLVDALHDHHHVLRDISLFLGGSAIGASGYWLLVRWFCLKSLRSTDWLRTVGLCMAATTLSVIAADLLNPSVDFFLLLTVPWWFGFSLSLYWSEIRQRPEKSARSDGAHSLEESPTS